MEYYRSIANLKTLKKNILISAATEAEIIEFIKDLNTTPVFNLIENNLLVFEIYYLLKQTYQSTPFVALSLDTIPTKIIFADHDFPSDEVAIAPQACDASKEEESCDNNPTIEQLIIAKWSPFRKENNPNLRYPAPGQLGDVQFTADNIMPDKQYHCEVIIDSEGNIINFSRPPFELITCENYEQIYAGLVGQLLEYQQ